MRLRTLTIATLLLLAGPAGTASAANRWSTSEPWVIAHQGGEDEFPSNTLYAFKKAKAAGAKMLELDIGVTKDDQIIVMHDTTVDRVTNGKGLVSTMTLKQIQKLDGAYWFSGGDNAYRRGLAKAKYRFRGVATGKRKPPNGYKASDFRVATLREVMKAFPNTPINVEIKGRTKKEEIAEYVQNAGVLARFLKSAGRSDVIVVSFKDEAVARFHELTPALGTSPGLNGSAGFLLGGTPVPEGSVALQLPVTYRLNGTLVDVATTAFIGQAHAAGLAWHSWFGDEDKDAPATWRMLVERCVDGIMTARPVALANALKTTKRPATCTS